MPSGYQQNDAPVSLVRNATIPLLPTNRAGSPIAPGPMSTYITAGGSDLQFIQQSEPYQFYEVDPNTIDVSPRIDANYNPPPIQQQPVPTASDLSDPYFGGSTITSLTQDPAASPQPMDMVLAASQAEMQRLAGYAGGYLYTAGSSVSPTTGTVVGGSDDAGQPDAIATMYQNVGAYSTGSGQQPPSTTGIAGTTLLQAQTEAIPGGPQANGLVLETGSNNSAQAQTVPGQMNPLMLALVGAFVVLTLVKHG